MLLKSHTEQAGSYYSDDIAKKNQENVLEKKNEYWAVKFGNQT